MSPLDKALYTLISMSRPSEAATSATTTGAALDERARVIVTLAYLIAMLSVELTNLGALAMFAIYPVAVATLRGPGFARVFVRSLAVLPLIVFIGIFNPIVDTAPAFTVGGVTITRGWLTFASIIIRGLLAVQAVVLLMDGCGFTGMCRAFGRMGMPAFMVTQLLMVNRYMIVLLQEFITINNARKARCGGEKLSMKQWAMLTGRLFILTIDRAGRIHRAMLARGFDGTLRLMPSARRWRPADTLWAAAWILIFVGLRFAPWNLIFSMIL